MSDALSIASNNNVNHDDNSPKSCLKLPLRSFNHIGREVLSMEKSRLFYCDLLGFTEVNRPPLPCQGHWLYGYGLSLHLVQTSVPENRLEVKKSRISHFSSCLPRVDHIAFMTDDIDYIRHVLDDAHVYYKTDQPCDGISQLFLFDPDGNVIEVSTCSAHLDPCPLDLTRQEEQTIKRSSSRVSDTAMMRYDIIDEDRNISEGRFSDVSSLGSDSPSFNDQE